MKNNVFLVSSTGGHYSELKKIKIDELNPIYIVEQQGKKTNNIDHKLIYGTRSKLFSYFFISIINSFKALYFFIKYRPKLLISTGAHSCVIFFFIAKLFKTKSIYIESFAKVDSPSLTYKIIKNVCDVVVVQHKKMLDVYEGSVYFGGLF